jgi:hypothetical protein
VSEYGGIFVQGHVSNNFMKIQRSKGETVASQPREVRTRVRNYMDSGKAAASNYDLFSLEAFTRPDARAFMSTVQLEQAEFESGRGRSRRDSIRGEEDDGANIPALAPFTNFLVLEDVSRSRDYQERVNVMHLEAVDEQSVLRTIMLNSR